MTDALTGVRAILLDIEGTTTPISFVYDVLFPFARAHLNSYLERSRTSEQFAEVVKLLGAEHAADEARGDMPPSWPLREAGALDSIAAYVRWLMDRDRKSSGLKLLQGLIWEDGYRARLLEGDVFPDVVPALRRWRTAGIRIAIYSSGSVLAQRLLFGSTQQGDVTPLIDAFFDTAVGPKTAPESYACIADALRLGPADVLFISDVTTELAAARTAGLQVLFSSRPGNAPQRDASSYQAIVNFDGIRPS